MLKWVAILSLVCISGCVVSSNEGDGVGQQESAISKADLAPKAFVLRTPKSFTTMCSAVATTTVKFKGRIDSAAMVPVDAWDAQNPETTSNFIVKAVVYDSTGASHTLSITFRKLAQHQWDYHVLAPSAEIVGGVLTWTEVGFGSIGFDTYGAVYTALMATTVSFVGVTPGQTIVFDVNQLTEVAGSTGVDCVSQDGKPKGVCSPVPACQ